MTRLTRSLIQPSVMLIVAAISLFGLDYCLLLSMLLGRDILIIN